MAVPAIDQLVTDVAALTVVADSAIELINGIHARIDAAVQEAMANGATAQELQPLTTLSQDLRAKTQQLADAVEANTTS